MSGAANRLQEIKDEVKALIGEAKDIVRKESRNQGRNIVWERAKTYWLAHIVMALDDDHEYLGSGPTTMQDTIEDLSGDEEDEEE